MYPSRSTCMWCQTRQLYKNRNFLRSFKKKNSKTVENRIEPNHLYKLVKDVVRGCDTRQIIRPCRRVTWGRRSGAVKWRIKWRRQCKIRRSNPRMARAHPTARSSSRETFRTHFDSGTPTCKTAATAAGHPPCSERFLVTPISRLGIEINP